MGFYHNPISKTSAAAATSERDGLQEFLASLTGSSAVDVPRGEATTNLFVSEIRSKTYECLLRPNEMVDPQVTLLQMGLDSLLSVELSRWFKSAFGIRLSVLEIVGSGMLKRLALVTARTLAEVQKSNSKRHQRQNNYLGGFLIR
ncbi:hypothetical protein VM1G_11624 [Cytospora mali]|uniref:Carrier domain-containing protein n=1 Tax=Cytospora mali TaxID=578113 RepID=A0A194VZF6_CYTMA|nr:hypothetical protein VM1G_11624 [Valsa mali]